MPAAACFGSPRLTLHPVELAGQPLHASCHAKHMSEASSFDSTPASLPTLPDRKLAMRLCLPRSTLRVMLVSLQCTRGGKCYKGYVRATRCAQAQGGKQAKDKQAPSSQRTGDSGSNGRVQHDCKGKTQARSRASMPCLTARRAGRASWASHRSSRACISRRRRLASSYCSLGVVG